MPAVATCLSVPTFHIPAGWGSEFRPEPQGDAGKTLVRNAQEVRRHWVERAEMLNASIALVVDADDGATVSYESVPPNRVFYMKTRYVFLGKGEPTPFELDEE